MKALVKKSKTRGDIHLENIAVPEPGPDRILAKVAYAGICQSDLDIINDKTHIYQPPVVLGHEFSAVVVEVGEGVTGFRVGDTVVSETALDVCGQCQQCRDGHFQLCANKQILGWTHDGGFAEHVLLNPRFTHKLRQEVDLKSAAIVEPLAIATESVSIKGGIHEGDVVVVIGPGPCGVLSALVAKEMGARKVFLVGRQSFSPVKMPIAKSLGIEHSIDTSKTNPVEYLLDNNHGDYADMVVDATGNILGFNTSLELVKRNGKIVELGSITTTTQFDWPTVAYKAIDLYFVFASSAGAWNQAIALLEQSSIEFRDIVTHIMPLEKYKEAFKIASDGSKSLKVLFDPQFV